MQMSLGFVMNLKNGKRPFSISNLTKILKLHELKIHWVFGDRQIVARSRVNIKMSFYEQKFDVNIKRYRSILSLYIYFLNNIYQPFFKWIESSLYLYGPLAFLNDVQNGTISAVVCINVYENKRCFISKNIFVWLNFASELSPGLQSIN